jgi:hypothetical protein
VAARIKLAAICCGCNAGGVSSLAAWRNRNLAAAMAQSRKQKNGRMAAVAIGKSWRVANEKLAK